MLIDLILDELYLLFWPLIMSKIFSTILNEILFWTTFVRSRQSRQFVLMTPFCSDRTIFVRLF